MTKERITPVKKYIVHWGYMQRRTEEFTDFQRALDHFVDHEGAAPGARLVGTGCGGAPDGLTDAERKKLEAVSSEGAPGAR